MKRLALFLAVLLPALAPDGGAEEEAGDPGTATVEVLDAAFGLPFWRDEEPWREAVAAVAARLRCPAESKTSTQSSYRLYPPADLRLFGARPYSIALYGAGDKPESLSIVFANRGDYEPFVRTAGDPSATVDPAVAKAFAALLKEQEGAIAGNLTRLLGKPRFENFGSGDFQERMRRWDWKGTALLLAAPRDAYVVLRIVPSETADRFGRADRPANQALRELLASRIVRRPNGDVLVGDIPMVDQGPKGYCVPATWERYLRYLSIPADMYVLAVAGGSLAGGGTSLDGMVDAASGVARNAGLLIVKEPARLTVAGVAASIDQGLPLMWGCYCPPEIEKRLYRRADERAAATDWAAYVEKLKGARTGLDAFRPAAEAPSHMRLIIGYNRQTDEIAISDSWGADAAERWITPEEARAVTLESVYLIKW